MATYGFFALSIASIAVMLVAQRHVLKLQRQITSGVVGSAWQSLSALVGFFTAGYLTMPFFPLLPEDLQNLIVGLIFLFGAIFVLVVARLFLRLTTDRDL
jgi:hypothetical protein